MAVIPSHCGTSPSSQSSDTLVTEQVSVCTELEIQGLPLEVIVVLNVNHTVNEWLRDVHEEESGHNWVNQSDPVLSQPEVYEAISFERMEGGPEMEGCWFL